MWESEIVILLDDARIADDIEIILSTSRVDKTRNDIMITSINELLPEGFGPRDLGIDVSKFKR